MQTLTYPTLGKSGRLGNQLWQISSTIGLARRQAHEFSPRYAQVALPDWKYHKYFSFPDMYFTDNKELLEQATPSWEFAPWVVPRQRGYLQDFDCIEFVKDSLHYWLQPSDVAMKKLKSLIKKYEPFDKTAVHVRRGDYEKVWNGINLLPLEYYMDNWPKNEVLLFSDDPNWCKEHLPKATIVHHEEWVDLQMMRLCSSHVISNSTFAWWGAYGSQDVTYPMPWIMGLDLNIFELEWKSVPRRKNI